MSDSKIYDVLAAEFAAKGKYYGVEEGVPLEAHLADYNARNVFETPTILEGPVVAPKSMAALNALAARLTELRKAEEARRNDDTQIISVVKDEEPLVADDDTHITEAVVDEYPSVDEVEHVFPIRRLKFGDVAEKKTHTSFGFFSKAA